MFRSEFDYQGEFNDLQFLLGLKNDYRKTNSEIACKQVDIPLVLKQENETKEGNSKIESHTYKLDLLGLIE